MIDACSAPVTHDGKMATCGHPKAVHRSPDGMEPYCGDCLALPLRGKWSHSFVTAEPVTEK